VTARADEVAVLWFRRDLRLGDHPALTAAAADGRTVVPLFVLDPALTARAGAVRLTYLHRALRALDQALGGALVVRVGDPRTEVPALAAEVGARRVVVTRETTPVGRRRDEAVATELARADVTLHGVGTPYAVDPGGVRKGDGTPYAVFTPFRRAWTAHGWAAPLPVPDVRWRGRPQVPGRDLTSLPDAVAHGHLPPADEAGAWQQWRAFANEGLDHYDTQRDLPAVEGTSRLSAALHLGIVHPRQLLAEVGDLPPHAVFASELAWRDFYADVLLRAPESAWTELDRRMSAMAVDTDAAARRRFARWAAGETGYPIVDAGMRQLAGTGWMHNRVRMIVASFLVKDLHLPWQWGARHFLDHLVDGDVASNNHGWQWAAGTGTAVLQGEKFDPEGGYVRRWVPELAKVPNKFLHRPWEAPPEVLRHAGVVLGRSYPAPMVDHAEARARALAALAETSRRTPG